ncbi:MAG: IclR family transcriptional regulator [Firmicutes bacterium]|jgi:DNA-binding IclR family transcriptional regulator|nr:IclR family transcriptional regulator [Bacillota bacterium]
MARRKKPAAAIQSAERVLNLLDILAEEGAEMSLTQISQRLGVHISTAHRLATTAMYCGYVEQNPETDKYRLGLKCLQLANALLQQLDLRRIARPFMEKLAEESDETVNICVLDDGEVVYIDKAEGGASLRLFSRIGKRAPAHATAAGKMLLAHLAPADVEAILKEHGMAALTPQTITAFDELSAQLQEIRRLGYSLDDEECEEGARCVAAPLYDHTQRVIAALSISGPVSRFSVENLPRLIALVRECARDISKQMGYAD